MLVRSKECYPSALLHLSSKSLSLHEMLLSCFSHFQFTTHIQP